MKQNVFLQLICFVCACSGYMPPELINENMISVKNDIFSLGVVIMEIMMGSTGYSQFKEMSSREDNEKIFIDLVRNDLFLFIKTGVHD